MCNDTIRQRRLNRDAAEQIGEPELARLSVFQRRFLRLQFSVCQRQLRWSANPVTSNVIFLQTLHLQSLARLATNGYRSPCTHALVCDRRHTYT